MAHIDKQEAEAKELLDNGAVEAKDVFISYRREDGATAARLLCDALERRQINTFFDKVTIGKGDFDVSIRGHLEAAHNFVLIVSPAMFANGLKDDGTYDQEKIERDWVCKEIILALDLKKEIIPVFVNGMSSFPKKLPELVSKSAKASGGNKEDYRETLRKKNGITLNHESFDSKLRDLIDILVTRKSRLLATYLDADTRFYSETDEVLLEIAKKLLNNERSNVIRDALSKIIRQNWEKTALSNEDALDALLDRNELDSIKWICEQVGLDNTGGLRRIKSNLLDWLIDKPFRKYSETNSQQDRVTHVTNACAKAFKSVDKRQQIFGDIQQKFGDTISDKSSSQKIFEDLFKKVDIEKFFKEMRFPEPQIKDICVQLFENDRGRKSGLIERIVDYVNYENDTADESSEPA